MKNPFLIFIHIEKAGGTTFHHIIKQNINTYVTLNNSIFWQRHNGLFTPSMFSNLIKSYPFVKGIGGHTLRRYFDYDKYLENKETKYLTFLREPISRYLSHYFYQKKKMGINWTLESFCASSEFNNFQTKKNKR